MPSKKPTAIVSPNWGLYPAVPSISVPPRGLQDGMNFRIRFGKLESVNLGWERFNAFTLDGPVLLIDNFFPKGATEALIFATKTSIYKLQGTGVVFLNPRIEEAAAVSVDATGLILTFTTPTITSAMVEGGFIFIGAQGQNDPAAAWHEIDTITDGTHVTLVTPVAGAPLAAQAYTYRIPSEMSDNDWWSTTIFVAAEGDDDQWIATNGTDWVLSWNGIDNQVTVHNELNFKCRALRTWRNMVIYANLTSGGEHLGTQMINSDVGSPFNAGDAGTGLSEQFIIHDGEDEILTLNPINDSLFAYSERHAIAIDFVGDPEVFAFRKAITGYGPIGPFTVAEFSDHHIFIDHDGAYRFDGVSSELVDAHFWPEMLRRQDPVRKRRIFCHFNEELADLMWALPLLTDPGAGTITTPVTQAQVLQYQEDVGQGVPQCYSRRAFPFTAAGYFSRANPLLWSDLTNPWSSLNFRWNDQALGAAYPYSLVGDAAGKVYILNQTQDADGITLPSFVRPGRRAVVDGRNRGIIRRVYPFVEPNIGDFEVTVRVADHAQGTATIVHSDGFDMSLPAEAHFTNPFRRGRYLELEFGSTGGDPWVISGWDIDAAPGGGR